MGMKIPQFLLELAQHYPEHKVWVEQLPFRIEEFANRWKLDLGDPFEKDASCSFVVPCEVAGAYSAILKIGLPHEEARDEIEGLRLLQDHVGVKLYEYDKEANAMLLEPCIPGTHLNTLLESKQDEVICDLLSKIWKVNYNQHPFRPLEEMVRLWNTETHEKLAKFPDRELAKEGCRVKEKLIQTTTSKVFLATDLHAGNVLRAERKEWLLIDPKPYVGDRAYDLTQHLLNCKERLRTQPDETIQRVAKLAGISSSRVKAWMFARLASEAEGENQDLALAFKE